MAEYAATDIHTDTSIHPSDFQIAIPSSVRSLGLPLRGGVQDNWIPQEGGACQSCEIFSGAPGRPAQND